MLTMFSAAEAAATAFLETPKDYSLYQHIEIRIQDAVRFGGTHIIYAGEMTNNVINALEALGYDIIYLEHDDDFMYRIGWEVKK